MYSNPAGMAVIVMSRTFYLTVAVFFFASAPPSHTSAGGGDATVSRRVAIQRRVDSLLRRGWESRGIVPAAVSSDSEFARRVYLDLAGVVPTVGEVRGFVGDPRLDKRAMLIDRLLSSPAHATHLATTWRNVLVPQGDDEGSVESVIGVQNWLRHQFIQNKRYDLMVADLLVATSGSSSGPALFFTSFDLKPEELASHTARVFLGLQIRCAQCHDHPDHHWTQRDFWGYAAFFARLGRSTNRTGDNSFQLIDRTSGELTLPGTQTVALPIYPGGEPARAADGGTRRMQLAIWMVSQDNRYFARATVNRVWAILFGRGLVEPVDNLGQHNPASHPEILNELADFFVETGFDLRELFRTLSGTAAYQLSSRSAIGQDPPPALFARMAVKPLSAEQMYDSIVRASLLRRSSPEGMDRLYDPSRQAFLASMASPSGSSTQRKVGPTQALMMMNGELMSEATDPQRSGMLLALEAPLFSDEQSVETLFLATLSRAPEQAERTRFAEFLRSDGPRRDRRGALADVMWALLNSAEFASNH